MGTFRINLKPVVAASMAALFLALPVSAGPAEMDALFERLKNADAVDAARIEREIELEWAKSGSPAMDLLLKRGRDALEEEDYAAAIEHLTALTDHAPDFAEGWYQRAQAYSLSGLIGPAVEDLERALVLEPRHYDAIFGLGTIFEQVGQPERAYDAYRLVLDIDPHHEEAQQLLKRIEGDVNGVEL